MTTVQVIDQGRELLRKQEWGAAFSKLTAPDVAPLLGPVDLEELAKAAYLLGYETDGSQFYRRAHEEFLNLDQVQDAARCAFWLGFMSLINDELVIGTGWLSRAERLLASQPDCCEKGYLLLPIGYRETHGGDPAAGHSAFESAGEIGNRFGDKDLITMALQGQGRSLIRQGEIARGVTLLDEAMVGVTAGEVSPMIAGAVYCSVTEGCSEIFDLRRAREWTTALEKWCSSHPEIVPYRGHCRVRRAEILQLEGAWPDAMDEAQQASEWLSKPKPRAEVGAALYCKAELHRFRGEFAEAEAAYIQAARWYPAQPGLAQLRLAQGQVEAANAAIRRVVEEVQGSVNRARVLDAYVEIVLAVNDVAAARVAADELSEIAERFQAPLLLALSSRAVGAVLLAEQDARRALAFLRQSWTAWCELEAPFEASRTGVLTALACRELGDEDAAGLAFPARGDSFPTKEQMADYLADYSKRFLLPVRNGIKVDRLWKEGDRFIITAGREHFESDNVVVAMANYQVPRVPEFARDLDKGIVQLHSHEYRNPSQLREGGVLVVGVGNSGAEIALEVARSHQTWISGKETGHIPWPIDSVIARFFLVRLVRFFGHHILTVGTPIGRKLRPKLLATATPLVRVKPKDLIRAGVETVPRVVAVKDRRPLLADDRTLDVRNVIWCTGYEHGFPWIDLPISEDHGLPVHDRGVVASVPGLYFVGLHFLYSMTSATLMGIGRDAARVVKAIARRQLRPA